jgi:hypothetical protein
MTTEARTLATLLDALEEAKTFVDRYRDYHTDPDSDIGAQIPNDACHLFATIEEAITAGEAAFAKAEEIEKAEEEQRQRYRPYGSVRRHDPNYDGEFERDC